uniref:Uncharacterized protein n=1 Tax=Timema poppense TaxID=170557 RepID=A0A7R9DFN4_TIMPO|nr:unnamed protein product [Timema poppensis]
MNEGAVKRSPWQDQMSQLRQRDKKIGDLSVLCTCWTKNVSNVIRIKLQKQGQPRLYFIYDEEERPTPQTSGSPLV